MTLMRQWDCLNSSVALSYAENFLIGLGLGCSSSDYFPLKMLSCPVTQKDRKRAEMIFVDFFL